MRFSQNSALGKHPGFDVHETIGENFSKAAVNLLGYAGVEVARFLGVTDSCVIRAALQELENLQIRYKNH
jgi:hypothetical protein